PGRRSQTGARPRSPSPHLLRGRPTRRLTREKIVSFCSICNTFSKQNVLFFGAGLGGEDPIDLLALAQQAGALLRRERWHRARGQSALNGEAPQHPRAAPS